MKPELEPDYNLNNFLLRTRTKTKKYLKLGALCFHCFKQIFYFLALNYKNCNCRLHNTKTYQEKTNLEIAINLV